MRLRDGALSVYRVRVCREGSGVWGAQSLEFLDRAI